MTEQPDFRMSQDLVILPPKQDRAYPIPREEWAHLKKSISKLRSEPWLFQNVGSLLLGVSLTAFLSILLGTFQLPAQQRAQDIAWSVFAVTGLCGILSWVYANKERNVRRELATDIVAQMELIEKRYEPPVS